MEHWNYNGQQSNSLRLFESDAFVRSHSVSFYMRTPASTAIHISLLGSTLKLRARHLLHTTKSKFFLSGWLDQLWQWAFRWFLVIQFLDVSRTTPALGQTNVLWCSFDSRVIHVLFLMTFSVTCCYLLLFVIYVFARSSMEHRFG